MSKSHAAGNVIPKPRLKTLMCLAVVTVMTCGVCGATEKGGSVWPVGAESYATAEAVPHAGQTLFYQYSCFYTANELVDAHGQNSGVPGFKVRVLAVAGKLSHNWGIQLPIGELGSYIAIPTVYEQLGIAGTTYSKDDLTNIVVAPVTLVNHKGIAYWYYELEVETLGTGYDATAPLNIGQHNVGFTPSAALTLTPHNGAQNLMARVDYIINSADRATHYHSGNEFFTQFGAQQQLPHSRSTLGASGYFYQQVTNDSQGGAAVVTTNADGTFSTGYKGRTLELGPQATFPWSKLGALVVKWNHDMLVQNRTRGNAFWFEFGVPFSYFHHPGSRNN